MILLIYIPIVYIYIYPFYLHSVSISFQENPPSTNTFTKRRVLKALRRVLTLQLHGVSAHGGGSLGNSPKNLGLYGELDLLCM